MSVAKKMCCPTNMKFAFVSVWSGNGDKPVAYIGPSRNLKPEVRRYLTPLDKQYILNRQGSRCNSCADHIVGVSRGGRTTLENMQLLCVQDHRAKSAREAQGGLMTIDIDLAPSDTNVYIFASETVQFPVDKRTPLEAITKGCGLSLLAFKKVDRTWVEVDFGKMLDKFVYKPRIAC